MKYIDIDSWDRKEYFLMYLGGISPTLTSEPMSISLTLSPFVRRMVSLPI